MDCERTRIAGIDEAGLGPLLGPLALGFSVFDVPRARADLWTLLGSVVARGPTKRKDAHLAVGDSKKVFSRSAKGLARLEATALAFLALRDWDGLVPRDARAVLFGRFAPDPAVPLAPWYAHLPLLPQAAQAETIELLAARLARALSKSDARLVDAGVRVVTAAELNASFARTGNKAQSSWEKLEGVLRLLWTEHTSPSLDLVVDMQGGRRRYGPVLARSFQDAIVTKILEDSDHSVYGLAERSPARAREKRSLRVEFRIHGEEHSFAVALASCLAKYARETAMEGFNAYFTSLQPGLRATAGYRQDGKRWLGEARSAIASAKIATSELVRER